jgi:hypothetical protein
MNSCRIRYALLLILVLALASPVFAQNGQISGEVRDPSGAVVPAAEVRAINQATLVERKVQTNEAGVYVFTFLAPGEYQIVVQLTGFTTAVSNKLHLTIGQAIVFNVQLQVGSATEKINVSADTQMLQTIDATVSTVVDHSYVENMPLNGRSFQSLIMVTPGIVNVTPQTGAIPGYNGEFNVNGQRDDANYYMVDGVSANVGSYNYGYGTAGTAGALPVATTTGTTQSLVSLDALEEFRVLSSTYSAEYGRTPGGQFLFSTRSGTNSYHGTGFDYLRNGVFDANNWFNDYDQLPYPGERQNDFGGTLGGPISIPHVYSGKDRTFFFFSYEGVRLAQPAPATTTYVPSLAFRAAAPAALQPVMNAFPLPTPGAPTFQGLAEFNGTGTIPNVIDATSIRVDEAISSKLRLFFRFANTPSHTDEIGYETASFAYVQRNITSTRVYTLGATSPLTNNINNEFRLNYTSNVSGSVSAPQAFGGSVPFDMAAASGVNAATAQNYFTYVEIYYPAGQYSLLEQGRLQNPQSQWNLTDTLSYLHGRHQFKFGIDYRRGLPNVLGIGNPYWGVAYEQPSSVTNNTPDYSFVLVNEPQYPVFINNSVFVQDEWKTTPKLSLSIGLRWEVNPAPGDRHHTQSYFLTDADNPATATLAPYGTSMYATYWYNFAPRFGLAYMLRSKAGWETVFRVGGGLFYDTGQVGPGNAYGDEAPGYSNYVESFPGTPYPIPAADLNLPIPTPNDSNISTDIWYAYEKHQQSPYTIQWNAALQQALGRSQTLTVSFVGSHADRLTQSEENYLFQQNPNLYAAIYYKNNLTADYESMQVQLQRRMSRGLQALVSYTYSHCIDFSSSDYGYILLAQRGNCDFDVRHSVAGIFTYEVPNAFQNRFAKAMLHHWAFDDHFNARTAYPIKLYGTYTINPTNGQILYPTLDRVAGQPEWLYGAACTAALQAAGELLQGQGCPGGRALNPYGFMNPPTGSFGDIGRNSVRGFPAWQEDIAVRREFPLHESLKLQFRAEAFNVFNHPNFGFVYPYYCPASPGCQFGLVTQTLNQSLGALSPIYQSGGPRSMQFALKFIF